MRHASVMLLWVSLCFQAGAGLLLYGAFEIRKTLSKRIILLAGLLAASLVLPFIGGLCLTDAEAHGWYKLAARLFL